VRVCLAPGLPFTFDADTVRRGLNFTLETTLGLLRTLIGLKRAAGRPKDHEVLAELEALLEERDTSP
jgi:hypothetical protein